MSTSPKRESSPEQRPSLWRPPEQRKQISEEGKRWLEENTEAIKEWNEWVEKKRSSTRQVPYVLNGAL